MTLSLCNLSLIGLTDSYKVPHFLQYPDDLEYLEAYFEARVGGQHKNIVFFELQYLLMEYISKPIKQSDIEYFEKRMLAHFGADGLYNVGDWQKIYDDYSGRLPVEIHAVPEGTVVPEGNILVRVRNTDERFAWVTNYIETLLCHLWYGTTVATRSRDAKEVITEFAVLTGSDVGGVLFKLHDFGFRGASSVETAAVGGAAHLINFLGTDTLIALELAKAYYNENMAGHSIPASEHSIIMSWLNETEAMKRMIEKFGSGAPGMFACVSDTEDIFVACSDKWGGELRADVEAMENMLIVRPDSGEVVPTVIEVLTRLEEKFGSTRTETGHMVLKNVRVIQGDGMDLPMITTLCQAVMDHGFAIENIAFGMGGGLLQRLDRDTCRFAFKACAVTRSGVEHAISKRPATDLTKSSKAGRMTLAYNNFTEEYRTVHPDAIPEGFEDVMKLVFRNGQLYNTTTFAEIRERAKVQTPVLIT